MKGTCKYKKGLRVVTVGNIHLLRSIGLDDLIVWHGVVESLLLDLLQDMITTKDI